MKYRRKPTIVEAEQFFLGRLPWPKGVIDGRIIPFIAQDRMSCTLPYVQTIHSGQPVLVQDGDWIIAESDGQHYYPCKAEVFTASYELADT